MYTEDLIKCNATNDRSRPYPCAKQKGPFRFEVEEYLGGCVPRLNAVDTDRHNSRQRGWRRGVAAE